MWNVMKIPSFFSKNRLNIKVKRFCHCNNRKILSREILMWNMKSPALTVDGYSFQKVGQTQRSRPQGKKFSYHRRVLSLGIWYIRAKYQIEISNWTQCSQVNSKVKFTKSRPRSRSQGYKNVDTQGKVLSLGILL